MSSKSLVIFKQNLNTLIKCSAEPFSCPMLKIWNICGCATHGYSFIHTTDKYIDMVSVANLHSGYHLVNRATVWRHKCGHVTFPGTSFNVSNFLVEMPKFKQAIKLTFGCNKFGKKNNATFTG